MSGRTGTITSWVEATRMVTISGIPGEISVVRHVVPVVGDTAVILPGASGQSWVVGVLGSAPPPTPGPEPSDPGTGTPPRPPQEPPSEPIAWSARPVWSGSWRSGSWRSDTSDLYQGDYTGRGVNIGGCWWGRLPSSIRDGKVTLARASGAGIAAGQIPTMALLAGTNRPAGAPTIIATAAGPRLTRSGAGSSADWVIPADWITRLAAGTAGGIGITSGGSRDPYLALDASGRGMTLQLTILD